MQSLRVSRNLRYQIYTMSLQSQTHWTDRGLPNYNVIQSFSLLILTLSLSLAKLEITRTPVPFSSMRKSPIVKPDEGKFEKLRVKEFSRFSLFVSFIPEKMIKDGWFRLAFSTVGREKKISSDIWKSRLRISRFRDEIALAIKPTNWGRLYKFLYKVEKIRAEYECT